MSWSLFPNYSHDDDPNEVKYKQNDVQDQEQPLDLASVRLLLVRSSQHVIRKQPKRKVPI